MEFFALFYIYRAYFEKYLAQLAFILLPTNQLCKAMYKFFYNTLLAHPAAVNETYTQHLFAASRFGVRLLLTAGACFVHALVPCLFTRKASDMLHRLHDDMYTHRAAKLDDKAPFQTDNLPLSE